MSSGRANALGSRIVFRPTPSGVGFFSFVALAQRVESAMHWPSAIFLLIGLAALAATHPAALVGIAVMLYLLWRSC